MASSTSAAVTPNAFRLQPHDWVPNNPNLPVLHYRGVIDPDVADPAVAFEEMLTRNGWTPLWRWGVYTFHHFHSTAHEVLGVARGSATLTIGGPGGKEMKVEAGDLIVLPAGTGHKNEGSSEDFLVVGAYPPDQDFDLQRQAISADTIAQMDRLAFPHSDPVSGANGPLTALWRYS
ncbi:cupin domain-containing protein [Acetobacter oeni]|nr:cupin domain-containing protein [Acetobacter oeni]